MENRTYYLEAFSMTAQYLAIMSADADIYAETAKAVTNFFGADFAVFAAGKTDGEMTECLCTHYDKPFCKAVFDKTTDIIAQTLQSGFLASEVVNLTEDGHYSIAFLPISIKNQTSAVMLIGHKTREPLPKNLLNIYLSVAGIIGTAFEKQASFEALKENEEKFRLISASANDAIIMIDDAGAITYWNEAAEKIFGYGKHEAIGRDLHSLIVPKMFYDDFLKGFSTFVKTGQGAVVGKHLEVSGIRRSGGEFPLELSISAVNLKGKWNAIGIARDISGRKKVEDALKEKTRQLEELTKSLEQRVESEIEKRRQQEQMLIQQSKLAAMGEMISAIAHQWRQPLNAAGLIIQNIKDAYEYGELDRAYLERAVENSMSQIQFMSKTIDDFRKFFRPDKEKKDFDAKQAAGEVLSMLSSELKASNISYRIVCHVHNKTFEDFSEIIPCGETTIHGHQNELKQVFLNLINNAKDAIIEKREKGLGDPEEKGTIAFDFEKSGEKVIIRILDNAGGIPEDIMDRVFEPYFTTKEQGKGTGIGLYMSKVIIENNMSGKLTVRNINGGAEFKIEL
jgi:PAS domain S-box-containing protein